MNSPSTDVKTIKEHAARVLNSEGFTDAVRLKQFLRYIVDRYCDGRTSEISQYSVGVEAFGFGSQFDPNQSSIVRMEAGRLRRRLLLYYATEGLNDRLRIEIPKGSYAPSIKRAENENKVPGIDNDAGASISGKDLRTSHPNLKVLVVPFHNISGDSELDYFGAGLAEEITSVLSLYKDFSIVPPIASRNMAGPQLNLVEIDKLFKARYVLDASIRKTQGKVRIIVQLSDTSDFTLLWTNTIDTDLDAHSLVDIENEIASSVVTSIVNEYDGVIPRIVAAESSTADTLSQSSYEAVLRIHHYNLSKYPRLIYDQTLQAILNARRNAPDDPNLLSSLAELKLDGYAQGWSDAEELPVDKCEELLDRALSLDRKCYYAFYVMGILRTNHRDRDGLFKAIEGLKSFAHSIPSQAQAGWFLSIAGEYEEGIALLDKNLAALQYYPGWFNHGYFLYHYENGRYEDALVAANQINMPGLLWDPVERAAALGKLGRYDEGKRAVEELLQLYPLFFDNPQRYLEMFIMEDGLLDDVIQGLELSRG